MNALLNTTKKLVAQTVKRLSAMQETWVPSLGWDDPMEKEMVAHSSILAWKIPWIPEPGRLPSMGSQRVGHDRVTSLSLSQEVNQAGVWAVKGGGVPSGLGWEVGEASCFYNFFFSSRAPAVKSPLGSLEWKICRPTVCICILAKSL